MLLHFIFVIKEEDLLHRKEEFEYIKSMAKFFQKWIKENFSPVVLFLMRSIPAISPLFLISETDLRPLNS